MTRPSPECTLQVFVYGYILFYSSKVISDGSEMLLAVYGPGLYCARRAARPSPRRGAHTHARRAPKALSAGC
jgi:hypothetical protein